MKASFSHLQFALSLRLHILKCQFWGMSRTKHSFSHLQPSLLRLPGTKASFSHLQLSACEGCLARKLRFRIFNFQFLRDVSHESFVFHILKCQFLRGISHESFAFTSSTFTFWGLSRTKASFSHLEVSVFEGYLAQKLRFHIFNFHFLRVVSHESFVFTSWSVSFWGLSRT